MIDIDKISNLINQQVKDFSVTFLSAKDITVPYLFRDSSMFWKNHGYSKEFYIDLIKQLYQVYENIEDIELDFSDYMTNLFFNKENAITVRYTDNHYRLATDGMHRILAAQELDAVIPVCIID